MKKFNFGVTTSDLMENWIYCLVQFKLILESLLLKKKYIRRSKVSILASIATEILFVFQCGFNPLNKKIGVESERGVIASHTVSLQKIL